MTVLPRQLRIPPAVLWSEAEEDVLILDADQGHYFRLSDVGACLWRCWASDVSVDASIDQVVADYAVDREVVIADALELIGELRAKGLVHVADS